MDPSIIRQRGGILWPSRRVPLTMDDVDEKRVEGGRSLQFAAGGPDGVKKAWRDREASLATRLAGKTGEAWLALRELYVGA